MRKDKIAVLGDRDSVLGFKAIGVDVFSVYSEEDARNMLKKIARSHKLIFITDDIAIKITDIISRYKSQVYPIVIPIPSSTGSTGYGIKMIRQNVEKAIGVDILFNREDN